MKRIRNWRAAGFEVSIRGGDGKLMSLDECIKPAFDALHEVQAIGREREMMRDVQLELAGKAKESSRGIFPDRVVVFDSGWYDHRPGDPLPPIESFRVSSR